MRAIEITDHGTGGVLEVATKSQPAPGEHEVRIDVEAIGVNFADIDHRRGRYPDTPAVPYVPGMEAAGTITETGPGVERTVGDRVVALLETGAYAETIVAPTHRLFEIPDSVALHTAAGFPVQFLTAHYALHERGNITSDDRVLIHAAAGGVGSAAVQLAATTEAEVFGTASTTEKLALACDLGLDNPINYEDHDIVDEIDQLTNETGVDLVLDGVGGEAFYKSLDALAGFGRVVSYGVASGDIPAAATPRLLFENKSVLGFHLGHTFKHHPERVATVARQLLEQIAADDLEVVIDRTFPLADAATAHEYVENRESVGKVLLEP
ncbi:MAG: zinc-binding alcohol dehydrogenase family protein [Haloarcula sp.]